VIGSSRFRGIIYFVNRIINVLPRSRPFTTNLAQGRNTGTDDKILIMELYKITSTSSWHENLVKPTQHLANDNVLLPDEPMISIF